MFYLTTHSTHFIYRYMASDIWLRTILIVRKETRCRHIGYSYRLTARVLLYAPSHCRITHTTAFVTPVVEHWLEREIAQWGHPMKDRSDDPSHHERTLPLSYVPLPALEEAGQKNTSLLYPTPPRFKKRAVCLGYLITNMMGMMEEKEVNMIRKMEVKVQEMCTIYLIIITILKSILVA